MECGKHGAYWPPCFFTCWLRDIMLVMLGYEVKNYDGRRLCVYLVKIEHLAFDERLAFNNEVAFGWLAFLSLKYANSKASRRNESKSTCRRLISSLLLVKQVVLFCGF